MLNEIEEFSAYTSTVDYCTNGKYDSTYLGRFTYDMLLKFEGLSRVLTVIARGYMFKNGTEPQIDYARRALCAWCSIPDDKKASPKADWQYKTNFKDLHHEFPELVDVDGCGWFYRHVHNVITFVRNNSDKVMKAAQSNCEKLQKGFDREWRKKVLAQNYPPQMRDLVISRNAGGFVSNTVAVMVMDILYGNGTFKELTDREKVTSDLVMFCNILPNE